MTIFSRTLVALALLGAPGRAMAAPGDLDVTFNGTGTVVTPVASGGARATAVVLQSDGKLVAAGYASNGTDLDFAVVRYDTIGTPDPSFGGTGKVTTAIRDGDDQAEALIQQTDGKLVAAGLSYDAAFNDSTLTLVRYLDNGMLDPGFGGGTGKVTTAVGVDYDGALALVQQTDGKLVVAGYSGTDITLARYETNGNLDMTFNGTGKVTTTVGTSASAFALIQQADGKLVVAGVSDANVVVARYDGGGVLDPMFGGGDGVVTTPVGSGNAEAHALVQQTGDGKLVVAGMSANATDTDVMLVRYGTDGTPDGMFGTAGIVTTPIGTGDDAAFALVQQADGKLVAAGSDDSGTSFAHCVAGTCDFALVRYDAMGTPDPGFGTAGIVTTPIGTGDDEIGALLVQPNGGLVAAGSSRSGSVTSFALARYLTLTTPTTSSTVTTTTTTVGGSTAPPSSTTTSTLPAGLVPGGPPTKASSDCYLELRVRGVANGTPAVQKNQVVVCIDGDPCDRGPCGDDRCDVEIAACTLQTDPALPSCRPPATLDKVKLAGTLGGSVGQFVGGPGCTPSTQVQVPIKFNRKGKYQAGKSKILLKGSAKAPKGVSPRKDADKFTIQCMPRAADCPS